MGATIKQALATDQVIDITTTGRKSGHPQRIEIWFHRVDGKYYITGSPGRRHWYANVLAQPNMTFHLKQSAQADLPARAIPVTDALEKQRILRGMSALKDRAEAKDLESKWAQESPLIEIQFRES